MNGELTWQLLERTSLDNSYDSEAPESQMPTVYEAQLRIRTNGCVFTDISLSQYVLSDASDENKSKYRNTEK
jgi:hypothetical protein